MVVERAYGGEQVTQQGLMRLEYTGPYSQNLAINSAFLEKLLYAIGTPMRSFVVRDGGARGREFRVDLKGNGSQSFDTTPDEVMIDQNDNEYLVLINSNVISAKLREAQTTWANPQEYYEREFKRRLLGAISGQMRKWSDLEVRQRCEGMGFFAKQRLKHQHGRLWRIDANRVAYFKIPGE